MRGEQLKAYLDTAIANDEFVVYFQPQYNILTEEIVGAEALVRWNYKKQGLMFPNQFIPVFEQDESIGKVDREVLRKVCEKMKYWKDNGYPLFPVSVNLSPCEIGRTNLVEELVEIVKSYDVDPELIDFELTESADYNDKEYLLKVMVPICKPTIITIQHQKNRQYRHHPII